MNHDVFISYSRKDTDMADRICAAFDKAGISYFIDRKGIAGGMEFPQVLADAIETSSLFLFLASENSYQSKFTNNEVLFAFNEKPHNSLLPYIIDGSRMPASLRFTFASINVRNINEHPIEPVLVDDVLRLLGREEEDSVHRQTAQEADVRQAAAEAERKAKAEAKAEAERKAKKEAERKPQVESERVAKEYTERKIKETVEEATSGMDKALKNGAMAYAMTGSPMVATAAATSTMIVSTIKQTKKTTPNADPKSEKTEEEKMMVAEACEQQAKGKAERVAKEKDCASAKPRYVLVGQGLTVLGKDTVAKFHDAENIRVANSVVTINKSAFEYCARLKKIILPNGLKSIETNAFIACRSLEKVVIPVSVTKIGVYAFEFCEGLRELIFAKKAAIKKIEQGTFAGCKQLESIVIPVSVGEVDVEAFWNCDKLKEVRLMNPKTEYKKYNGLLLKPSFPKQTKIIKG